MRRAPKVSAIIVSYNRADDLRLSIQALLDTEYEDLEIVVLDNASGDHSCEVASSFPSVRLIQSRENLGFAEGNNVALRACSGDYIALVNNDAVVAKDWLARLVDFLEAHPEAAAAGGKTYFWDEENPLGNTANRFYAYTEFDARGARSFPQLDVHVTEREVATLSGCAVVIRRSAIERVGGPFLEPEYFMYYEETDFFARAARCGYRMHYLGAAATWHRDRASTAKQPYRYHYYLERNRILFAYRNLSDATLRSLLEKTATETLGRWALHPLRTFVAEREETRAHRDAYRWLLENRSRLAEHRAAAAPTERPFDAIVAEVSSRARYYEHARPEILALIPPTARCIIDVGCGAGALGRAIKERSPSTEVRGIEISTAQAARARAVLDDVAVRSADLGPPSDWPRPDCVIFADVLEHLSDPWAALEEWKRHLGPQATVIASIPNVMHASVTGDLVRGRWEYRDAGVLDRTHLRFFERASIRKLFDDAGLRVRHIGRVIDPPASWKASARLRRWLANVSAVEPPRARGFVADVATVQYLVVADAP